jgi:hypothetical protein
MNSSTGMLKVNASNDNETGSFNAGLMCTDTEPTSDSGTLPIVITSVNDAPMFNNIYSRMNATEDTPYNLTINASDEENNTPFYYNLSFINCTTEEWSTRNSTNCTLFSINTTTGFINFTPTNDDVGNYTINFSIRDSGQTVQPYNATRYLLVIFEVFNINNAPQLRYICNNERNTTENILFSCIINATDIDESNNLTFSSNYSWFLFNNSLNQITVNYTNNLSTAYVNFTPNDSSVGNWTVFINVQDSGSMSDNESINFYVNNSPDAPSLDSIGSKSAYANAIFVLFVNATDDDLLIPDKSIYNESLNFTLNRTDLFNITIFAVQDNKAIGLINFTPSNANVGNHSIQINVTDKTGNSDTKILTLEILNNSAPYWDVDTPTNQTATEGSPFFLNVSQYVHDPDNDSMNLSSNTSSEFPSFNLTSYGVINFTADDLDVGGHAILITVTDNKSSSASKVFNFTVINVNDNPYLSPVSNVITEQENQTLFYLYAYDNDLVINDSIYNETLVFNKTVTNLSGDYRNLFNIIVLNTSGNLTTAIVNFTPNAYDVGNFTINISVKDKVNATSSVIFNLTIIAVNHAPRMSIDTISAGVNNTYTEYVIATDLDDDDITFSDNSTLFNIILVNETHSINGSTAYGLINFTPTDSDIGIHITRVSATDNRSAVNNSDFAVKIYDVPVVADLICTRGTFGVRLYEGNSSSLCFTDARQTISENMNYRWYLDNVSVQNDSDYGEVNWIYYPDYDEEGEHNLTVYVSNDYFMSSANITLNVTHNNAPPEFYLNITNISSSGPYTTLNLLNHFSDEDYNDVRYNQSINFTWGQYDSNLTPLGTPTISISRINYTLRFDSTQNVSEYVKITAIDSENSSMNTSSNYFPVTFEIVSETIKVPEEKPSSGGAGGSSQSEPEEVVVSINLVIPGAVTMYSVDEIIVPIQLINDGAVELTGITLNASTERERVNLTLNRTYYDTLGIGQSENTMLTIRTNGFEVQDLESFEIDVIADVNAPKVNDTAKILVNILETSRVLRLRAEKENNFLNEFIASNPECLELKETLNEAQAAFEIGDYHRSLALAEKAVESCKNLIKGPEYISLIPKIISDKNIYISIIVLLIVLVALAIFAVYYNKKRSNTKS